MYPGFVQQIVQDISTFFTAIPLSGMLLVHSIVGQSPLLALFEIQFDFLFPGGVATYEPIILQVCRTINLFSL